MKNVFINTSDIATYIGQSSWDLITPFERLWKKFETFEIDKEDETDLDETVLQNIKETFTTKEQKVEQFIPLESIKSITQDTTLNCIEKKKKVNQIVNKVEGITPDKRIQLRKNAETIVNTDHGIHNESSVLNEYEEKHKKTIDKCQVLYKKKLEIQVAPEAYTYTICGKIDGNDIENKVIIEVKNRVNGFFKNLRDYEKTQIHIYMWLLDYKEAMLVEKYKEKTKTTKIFFDQEYFDEIMEDLQTFLVKFEEFISSSKQKHMYMYMNHYEKKNFIEEF